MNGAQILDMSLNLLGYSENNGNSNLTQNIRNQALAIINLTIAELARTCDLECTLIKSLSETIKLPDRALNEVMPCGVAMYIANAQGDSSAQAFWGAEYNAKRATLTKFTQFIDTIPTVEG